MTLSLEQIGKNARQAAEILGTLPAAQKTAALKVAVQFQGQDELLRLEPVHTSA